MLQKNTHDEDIKRLDKLFVKVEDTINLLIQQISNGLHVFTQAKTEQANLEVEFRLGNIAGSRFISGVSCSSFQRILGYVRNLAKKDANKLTNVSTVQRCFENGNRIENGVSSTKQRLSLHDIKTQHHCPYDVRVSTSIETVRKLSLESRNEATYCVQRFKQRTSFHYKFWKYDITQVNCSHSLDIDNDAQTVYEVELELIPENLDSKKLYCPSPSARTAYIRYIVLSGLYKCADLLDIIGNDSPARTPVMRD